MHSRNAPRDFTDVIVIFNPKSTGSGREQAQELKSKLTRYDVRLVATKHAGHAEELSYKFAKASPRPLIISASGDGGYHEVVNGVIRAQLEGAKPTAGLLPAGNANDHYRDAHGMDIVAAINTDTTQQIDLLKLTTTIRDKPFERYAHSYVGFGLTPKVGKDLNKAKLNWLNEIWIVARVLFILRPIKIIEDGRRNTYDSLIFSNVSKMSKVLSLSKHSANDDGKFEVTRFRRRHKLRLIRLLIKASTVGLDGSTRRESYVFRSIKKLLVQVDGEVSTLDANSKVQITTEHKMLRCLA